MNKTLEGMVAASMEGANRVIWEAEKRGLCPATTEMNIAAQKAAMLWLADNISGEMLDAFNKAKGIPRRVAWEDGQTILAISAALRAAGDGR